MIQEIRQKLFTLQDKNYQQFQSKLCPGIDNIIGVPVPKIKNLVKKILKENYHVYLQEVTNQYYEETMIEGLIIAMSKMPIDDKLHCLESFIPKINNWAICDTVCANFKIDKQDLNKLWNFLMLYKNCNKEFELRFMLVMIINYFLIDDYQEKVLSIIDSIQVDYYYTNMAIAWLISILFIKNRKITMKYLKNNHLLDFTYQKSLQKILESNQVLKEDKEIIRQMKRR